MIVFVTARAVSSCVRGFMSKMEMWFELWWWCTFEHKHHMKIKPLQVRCLFCSWIKGHATSLLPWSWPTPSSLWSWPPPSFPWSWLPLPLLMTNSLLVMITTLLVMITSGHDHLTGFDGQVIHVAVSQFLNYYCSFSSHLLVCPCILGTDAPPPPPPPHHFYIECE